jgi:hypothetical protein
MKGSNDYTADWPLISQAVKDYWGWTCERCKHAHDVEANYVLTVHHLDGDKANNKAWNLACLCQRCHLAIQGRVFMPQSYMFEHSEWFGWHVVGYYLDMNINLPYLMEEQPPYFSAAQQKFLQEWFEDVRRKGTASLHWQLYDTYETVEQR